MAKKTIAGDDTRSAILSGINSLADAVSVTFGPKGRNVALGKKFGSAVITRDGLTVAKEIELSDRFENMAAQLIKEAAAKTAESVGDGSTTSTVLARAMFWEGTRLVAAGADPNGLKRGIEKAVVLAVSCLHDDSTAFYSGVSDAAKLSSFPLLSEILEDENLPSETTSKFLQEN